MRTHHFMPFGADVVAEGVRFSLFAPTAKRVDLVRADATPQPMKADGDGQGLYSVLVRGIGAGTRYRFRIDGDLVVPDPASRFQPEGIDADGLVVDSYQYEWRTPDWRGRPWCEAVIYEIHVGTATAEGTFAALAQKLPELAAFGITAIQLMPLADCPGAHNWGYDGVLLFAPNTAYGTPDDLRDLIDCAHSLGMMVFLDVVYNHFGPSGNYLSVYAKTFFTDRHQTPWGAGINVDGEGSRDVRAFFVQNALYWIEEFMFDGLRFDAVHAIQDDGMPPLLAELAQTVRARFANRHVHLIIENEDNASRWLVRDEADKPRLYTAQWNDDIHHCLHTLLTGESDAYYSDFSDDPLSRLGRALEEGFVYQGEPSSHLERTRGEMSKDLPPTAFVSFLQNHDQVGNRAFGERIGALTTPEKVAFAHQILLLAPQVPMLFMGEEWNASTPFLFFVDFANDPDLSKAVREGRRKEFARFAAFGDPQRVPDPTALDTFTRSKLDWSERDQGAHAEAFARIKALIAIRREAIVPLLAGRFLGATRTLSERSLDVTWRFSGGVLRLVINAGETPHAVSLDDGFKPIFGEGQTVAPWTCLAAVSSARG